MNDVRQIHQPRITDVSRNFMNIRKTHRLVQEAANIDATVHRMLMLDRPLEEIVCQLVVEKRALLKRIRELDSIAPRKFTLADGKVMVWHCPDEFIPVEQTK